MEGVTDLRAFLVKRRQLWLVEKVGTLFVAELYGRFGIIESGGTDAFLLQSMGQREDV